MPGWPYDPTKVATRLDTIGYGTDPMINDVEDIAMRSQSLPGYPLDILWNNGSANDQDWANPGKNSKSVY